MTEAEAKTKWCPFARVVSVPDCGETAANRYPDDEDAKAGTTNRCIGSACMAWRWSSAWWMSAEMEETGPDDMTTPKREWLTAGVAGKWEFATRYMSMPISKKGQDRPPVRHITVWHFVLDDRPGYCGLAWKP